jgi:hypothetical protein
MSEICTFFGRLARPEDGEANFPERDTQAYRYSEDQLEQGRRRRRIEDILEASRLEREALSEVWE